MGIIDGLRRQLRTVIEWTDPDPGAIFSQWTDNGDEIKNASRLIVGPGQGCIFVYEGQIRSLIAHQGMVDLKTDNIPFWTTVTRFMQAFQSEHKVAIYFFRTTQFLDQKWGTTSTIKYNDPKYNFPVGLKAYGNFSFQIIEPRLFFTTVVGGAEEYTADMFRSVMVDRMLQPLSEYLAGAHLTYTEIDAKREEIAADILKKCIPEFDTLGFRLVDFRIEGTDFDDSTVKRIGRIADVTAESEAAKAAGLSYQQLQQLEALREASRNEGGGAGVGLGVGAGMGFGKAMSEMMSSTPAQPAAAPVKSTKERLLDLKELYDNKLISDAEYNSKKQEILSGL